MAPVRELPPGITDSHPLISRVAGCFEASLNEPAGCCNEAGNRSILVCDSGNHRICRVGMTASIETVAGVPGERGDSDGDPHVAQFHTPLALCRGISGVYYIADSGNGKVRSFVEGEAVRTLVELPSPQGLALSLDGAELYVSSGSSIFVVKVDGGLTEIFAGDHVRGIRDGTRLEALLSSPRTLSMDSQSGKLFVLDSSNTATIRCVDTDGNVATLFQVPQLCNIAVDYDGTLIALTKGDILLKKPCDGKLISFLTEKEIQPFGILLPAPPMPPMPPREPGRTIKYFEYPRGICVQGSRLILTDANDILAVRGAFGPEVVLVLEVSSQGFCVRWAASGEVLCHVSSSDLGQIESETQKIIPFQRFRLVWKSGEKVSPESAVHVFQLAPAAPREVCEEDRATLPLALLLDRDRARAAGVDMQRREMYLSDADCVAVFACNMQEFLQLPKWKQLNLKRASGLF